MADTFLKATKVVSTALGLLLRELTLPQLVWRDPVGNFAGAFNDTITVRLPAYAPAHSRVLRSGTTRTKDTIHERAVNLTLDTDIYKWVGISDEELTLDIGSFGEQVLVPITLGIVQALEDKLATTITAASYENSIVYDLSSGDAYKDIAVPARQFLNAAYVPFDGRALVVGSQVEAAFLNNDFFIKANEAGSDQTLREARIGRVAGFDVYTSPAIPPNEAFAFHRTAYAMSSQIPVVPSGAPWGAQESYDGFSLRFVRAFDIEHVEDQLSADTWVGATAVTDFGHYTDDPAAGGTFVPGEDPTDPIDDESDDWANDSNKLVRAVKITTTA